MQRTGCLLPILAVMLLLLVLTVAAGCSRSDSPPPSQMRFAYSWAPDFVGPDPTIRIEAEQRYRPLLSKLVADPESGVWGSQEGELFRFRAEANGGQSRATYGRPHPAAVSLDDLVLLSPTVLAGRVLTSQLVRQAADGRVYDVAPALAPDGAPFDILTEQDGKLSLRSARPIWYSYDEATRQFRNAGPLKPAYGGDVTEEQQRELGQATNGHIASVVVAGNGSLLAPSTDAATSKAWALVAREQLFRFDLTSHQFTLLGSPVPAGTGSRPIGGLDGGLVVQSTGRLALLDGTGRVLRAYATTKPSRRALPGTDGWFYLLPEMAVNVATGEVRTFPVDVQNGTDGLRVVYGGSATVLIPLSDGRLVGGTGHFGSLFVFHPATGDFHLRGRPLPELGQESGEEIAPIQGLARDADGYLYAAVGTGARGTEESHIVRLDTTGRVTAWTRVAESIHDLVSGADGRIYGAALDRVVVIEPR